MPSPNLKTRVCSRKVCGAAGYTELGSKENPSSIIKEWGHINKKKNYKTMINSSNGKRLSTYYNGSLELINEQS